MSTVRPSRGLQLPGFPADHGTKSVQILRNMAVLDGGPRRELLACLKASSGLASICPLADRAEVQGWHLECQTYPAIYAISARSPPKTLVVVPIKVGNLFVSLSV